MIDVVIYGEDWHPVYEISYPKDDNDILVQVPVELLKEYIMALTDFVEVQKKIAKLVGNDKYYFPGSLPDETL